MLIHTSLQELSSLGERAESASASAKAICLFISLQRRGRQANFAADEQQAAREPTICH